MASNIPGSSSKREELLPNENTPLECVATLDELKTLMEYRDMEAHKRIDELYAGINGLCQKLGVNPSKGLPKDPNELEMRRKRFGSNKIPAKRLKSIFEFAWEAMQDRILITLMVSATASIALSFLKMPNENGEVEKNTNWIEGAAIFASIFIVISATAINNYTKEQQFCKLKSKIEAESEFLVIRDGEQIEVLIHDLVVGDILLIKYGNSVPADGILVQGNELKVDESSLTGECDLIKKSIEADVVLLSGTHLMEGNGRMLVTAVGVNSQTGIIMTLLGATNNSNIFKPKNKNKEPFRELNKQESLHHASVRDSLSRSAAIQSKKLLEEEAHTERSILRHKLEVMAGQIGFGGVLVAFCTIIVLLFRFCVVRYSLNDESLSWADVNYFVYYFIIGVTVLVVAVPEGLPLAVTLALTYSCKKMMKDNNLVRHMDSCETMGNATSICSDKTGTLTTNRMTVIQSYINGTHYAKTPEFDSLDSNTRTLLMEAISINCSYTTQYLPPDSEGERAVHIGNKTECALLGFVLELGQSYESIRRANPEESLFKIYTFNSSRKMMMTVIKLFQENGTLLGYRVFCKGASEIILSKCSYFVGQAGKSEPFNDGLSKQLLAVIESMAQRGLRTICIGYKDLIIKSVREPTTTEIGIESENAVDWNETKVATSFIGLAICGIQDPVRSEVPEAIKQCQEAGIVVRMVTGDNVNTARSIALSCGILTSDEDHLVLEGRDFNERIRDPSTGEISQDRLDEIWPRLRVLARAQPVDKFNLVRGIINSNLNKNREIVAVTGDGTNDGPALKKADVGFAMGIAGTDVAKQACDIILTDDNFSSIVKAVMWGRNIYDTITKFLQFQLTVNLVAIIIVFVSACSVQDSPLKAVQILWVNLAMDSLGSLALATENPTKDLLKRKPYGRKSSLISSVMARNIVGHGSYMLVVLLVLMFAGPSIFGFEQGWGRPLYAPPTVHFTIIFNTFVLMTQFNEINARKIHDERNVFKGLFNNWIYCAIWISTFAVQVILVQFGDTVFTTAALNWWQWLICLTFGLSVLAWHRVVISIPPRIFCQFKLDKDTSTKTEHVWTPNPSPSVKAKSTRDHRISNPVTG
ncbi:Calcium ATPase [Aphelenchoides bicaudatus]|nr:Calcium ATPase [Aphelenchoides bicaudatus]